jgi:hypothetical protein
MKWIFCHNTDASGVCLQRAVNGTRTRIVNKKKKRNY